MRALQGVLEASAGAVQAHIECELTIEEETPDTCRQTLEGNVDIHIFGLGKVHTLPRYIPGGGSSALLTHSAGQIAESIIADNLRKVYGGIPAIVERWVEFRNEVLKQPGGQAVLVSGRPDNHDVSWINQQIEQLISVRAMPGPHPNPRATAGVRRRPASARRRLRMEG